MRPNRYAMDYVIFSIIVAFLFLVLVAVSFFGN